MPWALAKLLNRATKGGLRNLILPLFNRAYLSISMPSSLDMCADFEAVFVLSVFPSM
jgi:hypothetical protein